MKISEWSEEEVNREIARRQGFEVVSMRGTAAVIKTGTHGDHPDDICIGYRDYCNNWADIGPLIQEVWEDLMSKPDWCLLNTNLWDYWATVGGSLTKGAALAWLEVKGMKENGQ